MAEPVQRLARPELNGQYRPRLCRKGLPQRLAQLDAGLLEQGERARVDRLYGAIRMAGDEAGLGVVDEVEGIGPLHLQQLQAEVAQAVAQPVDLVPPQVLTGTSSRPAATLSSSCPNRSSRLISRR